jgi:hypothetical protein
VGLDVYNDTALSGWLKEEPWSAVFLAQFPDLESVTYLVQFYGTSVTKDEDEDLSISERNLTFGFNTSIRDWTCRFCGSSVLTGKGIVDTIRGHLERYREKQEAKGVVWKVPRLELAAYGSPKIWSSEFFLSVAMKGGAVKEKAVKEKTAKGKRAKATRGGR